MPINHVFYRNYELVDGPTSTDKKWQGEPGKSVIGTGSSVPAGIEAVFSYNDVIFNDLTVYDKYRVMSIDGLADPNVRDTREDKPGDHGEDAYNSYYGGRTISMTIRIEAYRLDKLRDMEEALRTAFADLEEKPLYFLTGIPENDHYIMCKKSAELSKDENVENINHRHFRTWQVTLRASDPRFYRVNERTTHALIDINNPDIDEDHFDDASSGLSDYEYQIGHPILNIGNYENASLRAKPSLYIPLDSINGLTNLADTDYIATASVDGPSGVGDYSPGPYLLDDYGATDFDGTNDRITTNYGTRRNFMKEPSVETGRGTWLNNASATSSQITTDSKFGNTCLKVNAAATSTSGVYSYAGGYDSEILTPNATYTVSAYVKAADASAVGHRVRTRITEQDATPAVIGTTTGSAVYLTNEWQRVTATRTFGATGVNGYIWVVNVDNDAFSFLADGFMFEQTSTAGSYFDGSGYVNDSDEWVSDPGGHVGWTGTAHASASDKGCFANGTTRTFAGWAYRDTDTAYHYLFGCAEATGFGMRLNDSAAAGGAHPQVYFTDGTTTTWSNTTFTTAAWHHWALVIDEANNLTSLYIDGVLDSTETTARAYAATVKTLVIGTRTSAADLEWNGKMAGVAVWERGLGPREVADLYEASRTGLSSGANDTIDNTNDSITSAISTDWSDSGTKALLVESTYELEDKVTIEKNFGAIQPNYVYNFSGIFRFESEAKTEDDVAIISIYRVLYDSDGLELSSSLLSAYSLSADVTPREISWSKGFSVGTGATTLGFRFEIDYQTVTNGWKFYLDSIKLKHDNIISELGYFTVQNDGNFNSSPVISVTGEVGDLEIINSNAPVPFKNIKFKTGTTIDASDTYTIDIENKTIVDKNGNNKMGELDLTSGWMKIAPGVNTITIGASTTYVTDDEPEILIQSKDSWI